MDDGMFRSEFVGFRNYFEIIFQDKMFWSSMLVLFYLFIGMNICCLFPLIAAKLTCMLRSRRLQFFVRSAFTITTVVPSVVTLMIWKFIYYPEIGMIARILERFGLESLNLLGNEATVIPAIIAIGFPWVNGLTYLMYCATLQGIDTSMLEAARIDGATEWQIFKKIELPVLKPVFISFYILAFINQFHDYERFLILTNGGPNYASTTPALYMYQKAFGTMETDYGYACAMAMILFIITFILSKVLMKGEAKE
jgi:raffinose/stachyose/melibiose transport system permease protein